MYGEGGPRAFIDSAAVKPAVIEELCPDYPPRYRQTFTNCKHTEQEGPFSSLRDCWCMATMSGATHRKLQCSLQTVFMTLPDVMRMAFKWPSAVVL